VPSGRVRAAPGRASPAGSKGVAKAEVDEARPLVAEADVDARHERLAERDARAASVAPAEVVVGRRDRRDRLAELAGDVLLVEEYPTRVAERHAVDLHLPDVEEVEVEELQSVLGVHHHV